MTVRTTLYWMVTIAAFFICMLITIDSEQSNDENEFTPIKLTSYLKVEPRFFYFINNQFHAVVNGKLRLDIKTELIQANLAHYNTIIISGFQFTPNTQASLNWTVNNIQFQAPINNTDHSISTFEFKTKNPAEIQDLHMLIESNAEIGHQLNIQDEISFDSIYLDVKSSQNMLSLNFSDWLSFSPVKFNSINGYSSSQELPFKGLILRTSMWLICSIIVFLLVRINGINLIATVGLAWAFTVFFYAHNHFQQHNQLENAYSAANMGLNKTDQLAIEMAESIESQLNTHQLEAGVKEKLVLVGFRDFFNQRLLSHLLSFDISIKSGLHRMLSNDRPTKPIYILARKYFKFCKNSNRYYWLKEHVEFIHSDESYCLMRKK